MSNSARQPVAGRATAYLDGGPGERRGALQQIAAISWQVRPSSGCVALYSSIMAMVSAAATHSTGSPYLAIPILIIVLAATYFSKRNYFNKIFRRRNRK